jgi:putative tryptophan/tyrosine transport system substrate-binding protein
MRGEVVNGGLMSYGSDLVDLWRRAGTYAGQILKVEKPATCRCCNRPNESLSSSFKRCALSGTKVPPGALSIADEVIE